MGNTNTTNDANKIIENNYYNTINKKTIIWNFDFSDIFIDKSVEINNMKNMFRKHINDYILKCDSCVNDDIKIVTHLDDFYDLLSNPMYKGYMQIYERKLCGYMNPNFSEEVIKSNREIPNYLFEIINEELKNIIKNQISIELLVRSNYVTAKKLNKKIQKLMELFDKLEGNKLTIASKQLAQMIRAKRCLIAELTENKIIITSDADMYGELAKIKKNIAKCNAILKRIRFSIQENDIKEIDNINDNFYFQIKTDINLDSELDLNIDSDDDFDIESIEHIKNNDSIVSNNK